MNFNFKEYTKLGSLIVLSGASGSGKSTIYKRVLEELDGIDFSVSCTTRKPRIGEVNGKDYYFITEEVFKKHIEKNDFLEYAYVHSNYYGTLKSEVIDKLKNGRDVLLDVDVQGAMAIKKLCEKDSFLKMCSAFIFILPPDIETLEMRLRLRNTESEKDIEIRLNNAKKELPAFTNYDFCIINNSVEESAEQLKTLILALRLKTSKLLEK